MITIRKSGARGAFRNDWLDSKHTFSFGTYHDPEHIHFGHLRVINEDIVAPSGGFETHPHRDMEIITYVLSGALEHKDSLGNGSVIVPGDVQRMSAGTGIKHSEFNPQPDVPVHLLQIWIVPDKKGVTPSYEQKNFTKKRKPGQLTLLASHDGKHGSVSMHQDANIYVLDLERGQRFDYTVPAGRMSWIQAARGAVDINDTKLGQGDGAAVSDEKMLRFAAGKNTEILLFDLAA